MSEPEQLAGALRRRDESVLGHVYDRYGRMVYALALRITGDPGEAEEVCLDAFWQLWLHAERFNAAQGSLQSWLLTIARTRAIDRRRARGAQKRTQVEDPTDVSRTDRPDEAAELAQRQRLVREAIAGLSADQRTALSLAYYEGLSHSQIAARLQEPLGTVKTRIRQAMIALRRALGPVLATP